MRTLLPLLALLGAGTLGATLAPDPGFLPDERLSPPGGPEILLFRSGPPGLVTLRLSFPLSEAMEEAGAGQILRIQAEERMRGIASRVGAEVEVHRTPHALVYLIVGARSDLDFLIWALREGLRPPPPATFASAHRQVLTEVDRRLETPEGVLVLRLRQTLAPEEAPIGGTRVSLERIGAANVHAIWARSHLLSSARLVVVGQVSTELILASLSDLGLPAEGPRPQLPPPLPAGVPRGSPELIRHWLALAWPIEGRGAAELVVARLAGDALRERPGPYETGVELWDLARGRALVVSGAAYPRSQTAMRNRVEGLLGEVGERITATEVRRIAEELRTELLFVGRTPAGLADLVGQAWDTGLPPEGVDLLLEELATLGETEVRSALQALRARSPAREELRP